ncbi:MAG: tetratricopeptide repeat protein [Candidatus Margulisiibacteriota bacterium]
MTEISSVLNTRFSRVLPPDRQPTSDRQESLEGSDPDIIDQVQLTYETVVDTDLNNDGTIDEADEFIQRVDGNTGGQINGEIETDELLEEIFEHREQYADVIEELREAGLEDPFQITQAMEDHVSSLFESYTPETQLDKALLLFMYLIPSDQPFEFDGEEYYDYGLEEGLNIHFDSNSYSPARLGRGNLLPQEILETPGSERIANCLEYSQLLVCFLRTAGIEAYVKEDPGHAYVIANLDGQTYRLDPAKLDFARTDSPPNTDREVIAAHHFNEGSRHIDQDRFAEGLECLDRALEIRPDYAIAWNEKGALLHQIGNNEEALACFNQAIEIDPNEGLFWKNSGVVLMELGRTDEARISFERYLELEPEAEDADAVRTVLESLPQQRKEIS